MTFCIDTGTTELINQFLAVDSHLLGQLVHTNL
jgi:hypothetical protein